MSNPGDDQLAAFERENRTAWTMAYKWPIVIVTGILALICASSLFDGRPFVWWIGAIGLALLIGWVSAYRVLYNKGY